MALRGTRKPAAPRASRAKKPAVETPKTVESPVEETAPEPSLEERVRSHAYTLWEQEGSPEGRHDEFWYRAERELSDGEPGTDDALRATANKG